MKKILIGRLFLTCIFYNKKAKDMRLKNILFCITLIISINCYETKKMNILFMDNKAPDHSRSYIIKQMTGLIDKGHTVFCYALSMNKPPVSHPDFVTYNLAKKFLTKNDMLDFLPLCDVVICERGTVGLAFFETIKPIGFNGRIITCFRGKDISIKNHASYHALFEKGDLFLPVCDHFKDILMQEGCSNNKIIVHPSAINCDQFYYKERTPKNNDSIILISVSRLIQKKGLEYTIQALHTVCKKYKNIQYWIIGTGGDEKRLKELVNQLGLSNNVFFLGNKSQEEVASYLHQADIFVLPSVIAKDGNKEGIPNALKEAMATGLPVISTYHSGIPELVTDNISGFLVPEKDVTALADRIEHLIKHQTIWSTMGAAGRKCIEEKFSKEVVIDELERLLLALCNEC